jgi:hypothetical protein
VGAQSLYGNPGATLKYRFQRVSPMEVSPNDPKTIYYGSQFLHRTRDGGVTWETISPDLTAHPPEGQGASGEPITRDATGEEVYSTLYSIRESPVQKGLIWTGSNDGLIFVTRDDGKNWTNVTPAGLEPGGRVQNIEPSPRRAGTAYAAIYRYLLGDFAPYIYRTDDYGKSWTKLTDGKNGIAADEPTRVVREDPDREGLLYAGTEFGIYVSFDNGTTWQSFQLNLPVTPVTDIKIAHKDLVLATQGRSFWILDDLTPLQQANAKISSGPAFLYTPRDAVRSAGRGGFGRGSSLQYPQAGAMLDYYLSTEPSQDISMEILDATGKVVRRYSSVEVPGGGGRGRGGQQAEEGGGGGGEDEEGGGGGRGRGGPTKLDKTAGMHRFIWDLRTFGPWMSATRPEGPNGPMMPPGKYAVRLTVGAYTSTAPFNVIEDPRVAKDGVTVSDLQQQYEHNIRVRDLVSETNKVVARVRASQASLKGSIGSEAEQLAKVNEVASHLITPAIRYSQPELQTHVTYLYGENNNTDQKVGHDAMDRYLELKKELEQRNAELIKILGPPKP